MKRNTAPAFVVLVTFFLAQAVLQAQGKVTSPKEEFGFDIGADYVLVNAQIGKGKLFVSGPEITYRGQPHGTFKFLFNGLFYGRTETVNLSEK